MNYVGIDLGTTNSAISSYDGEMVRLYKSPEQHDVTPSAIFFDKRGNKYVGSRAYNNAARSPDNAATVFKRLIGTSTPVKLSAVNLTLTAEECSAEILRTLFGYLPEELRNDERTGTVITVPAAFNQMQKDATMSAAERAGIGKVALMQEPVAAVMSVMRQRKNDGSFLVYDLGGGTLDIAVAESTSGRVSLLSHGGIAMCGGRDFDRLLFDGVVKPWLLDTFDLPDNFAALDRYLRVKRLAEWAAEKAKIELSQRSETVISLGESELGAQDASGAEIYLDIPLDRARFDELVRAKVDESIQAAREALEKVGLGPQDVECVVFVGGPTQYKPLRDRVASELGIAASTEVNPMTAVAEGAAIFSESIDWTSQGRGRKSVRGAMEAGGSLDLTFNYIARTPDTKAKIVPKLRGDASGMELQVDSLDTGWSSGRVPLRDGAILELALSKAGDNTFKVFVFDASGGVLPLARDKIVISRTAATVDAIPASHTISVAAKEKLDGAVSLVHLVRAGEQLPKKGRARFRAGEALEAGHSGSLNFQLWEGEIPAPISDNRPIGVLKIRGKDFVEGKIEAGAELICDYEVHDSGRIVMEVSVPSIAGSFGSGHNFYSRQEDQIDYSQAAKRFEEDAEEVAQRLSQMEAQVSDSRFKQAREKMAAARALRSAQSDAESAKEAMDAVQEVKRLLSLAREAHLKEVRQMELDKAVDFFDRAARPHARPSEITAFENLVKTAQRSIDTNSRDFESHLEDIGGRTWPVLWRLDWFVIQRFQWLANSPHHFSNATEHGALVASGNEALRTNEIDKLRAVVWKLEAGRVRSGHDDDFLAAANIVRG